MGKKTQQVPQNRAEPLGDVSDSMQNRIRSTSLPSNLENYKTDRIVVERERDPQQLSAEAARGLEELADNNPSDGISSLELNSDLYHMLSSLSGVSGNNSIVQLVAKKFDISEQLAGEITAWFKSKSKDIQLQSRQDNIPAREQDEKDEKEESGKEPPHTNTSAKLRTETAPESNLEERIKQWRQTCLEQNTASRFFETAPPLWFDALHPTQREAISNFVDEASGIYNGDAFNVKADLVAKFRLTEAQANEIWNHARPLAFDYKAEVLQTLFDEESKLQTPWQKLPFGGQREAYIVSRVSSVEIMTEFVTKYKLKVKTLEAAVHYLDRLLRSPNFNNIIKPGPAYRNANGSHSLYTIALCVLFISSKFEEIYPPPRPAFTSWCPSNSNMELLEVRLLEELGWDLSSVTPTDFIGLFHEAAHADRKTKNLSMFILESSYRCKIIEQAWGSNRKWNIFQKNGKPKVPSRVHIMAAKPSQVAIACLALSLAYQGKIAFNSVMCTVSRTTSAAIGPLVKELHEQLRKETSDNAIRPSCIVKKYSHRRHSGIGTFRPPSWSELVRHNAFRGTQVVSNQNR